MYRLSYKKYGDYMKIVNDKVKTSDGFLLDVEIRIPDERIKKTIVMSHGLASCKEGSKKQLLKIANALCIDGYRVIQYDFRGHGRSSGTDLDVCLSALKIDLETIIDNYIKDDYYLFGFSIGGLATCDYLYYTNNKSVKKIVLIGPPLDPANGLVIRPNKLSHHAMDNVFDTTNFETKGYIYWKTNKFKLSKKFLEEFTLFDCKAIGTLSERTLLLQGKNDMVVNKEYNKKYSRQYNFKYKEFDASHSLYEKIDDVIIEIIKYYNN